MLGVGHAKIILLSTPFPTIPMLATNCCCNVVLFYVGHKTMLYYIVFSLMTGVFYVERGA